MNRYSRTLARVLAGVTTVAMALTTTLVSSREAQQPTPSLPELVLDAAQQAALGVRLAPVQATSSSTVLASALVALPPGREVVVAAPFAGTITRVETGVGDNAATNAPLAWMSSSTLSEARRQWREAQLDVDQWRLSLRREQALLEEGLIPQARLDLTANRTRNAEAALAARDAELRAMGLSPTSLKDASDFTGAVLRAPQAGSVIETFVTVGQRVDAGAPLFRLADTRQLQLDLQLSVDKARQVRSGDRVIVSNRQATAVIVGVSRATDSSHIVRARARVTQPGQLAVGETVAAQIQSAVASANAWRVPVQAVMQHPSMPLVFVATPTGLRPTPVRVLFSDDDSALVEGALLAQSRVAVAGVAALRALQQREP